MRTLYFHRPQSLPAEPGGNCDQYISRRTAVHDPNHPLRACEKMGQARSLMLFIQGFLDIDDEPVPFFHKLSVVQFNVSYGCGFAALGLRHLGQLAADGIFVKLVAPGGNQQRRSRSRRF